MSLEMILENKRDDYLIQVLEESTTELETLKTKKYLTENLNLIEKILVEEGLLDTLKNHGGKIAAGVGLGAAATYGMDHSDQVKEAVHTGIDKAKEMYHNTVDNKPEGTEHTPSQLEKDRTYTRGLDIKNNDELDKAVADKKVHPDNTVVKELRNSFGKSLMGPKRQGE